MRMRICLFRAFPDPYRKSMRVYADQLQNRLAPLLRSDEEVVGCLPDQTRLRPKLARYWDQYLRYQQYARDFHGDVNHVIDHSYGHLVRSLPRHSSIVTFHDATATKVKGVSLSTRVSLRYSLQAMRGAARIVTASQASRRDLLELIDFPEDRLHVVYLGIDTAFQVLPDRERLRAEHGLPHKYLLHVGHNLHYMNLERVIRVLGLLVDGGLDLRLVKIGDEFTEPQTRLIQQLGLEDRIRHVGRVRFAELPVYYNCAEVLLYPVLHAGFGLPPLEAMACGVPVVCSDRGALPEILGDAPLYAGPEETAGIAEGLARLLGDQSLRETHVARGFERAKRYNWDHTVSEMLSLYRVIRHAQDRGHPAVPA